MIIKHIKECYCRMEHVSKIITKYGAALSFIIIAGAFFVLLFGERLFFDYDTALYWFEELIILARETAGATIVPTLIFEILFIAIERK